MHSFVLACQLAMTQNQALTGPICVRLRRTLQWRSGKRLNVGSRGAWHRILTATICSETECVLSSFVTNTWGTATWLETLAKHHAMGVRMVGQGQSFSRAMKSVVKFCPARSWRATDFFLGGNFCTCPNSE